MTDQAAGGDVLPTRHIAQAALNVASVLDRGGSHRSAADETYWHHATGGVFPPQDLKRGEELLIQCGLVIERDRTLFPIAELDSLLGGSVDDAYVVLVERVLQAAVEAGKPATLPSEEALASLVPDAARREELLLALGRTFDDERNRALGAAGEQLVVTAAREELISLGRTELAREVRQLSLISDQLGYDVVAPRLNGSGRLLEVKATGRDEDLLVVHLSRNEAKTGERYGDWALVICIVEEFDPPAGRIAGWCSYGTLADRLPVDTPSGRWEQAELTIDQKELSTGLPRAVA
jgi:hypothetical protein